MEDRKKVNAIMMELFEELLEVDNLETALDGMLEILIRALKCEGGVLWLLDRNTERLVPVFYVGPGDLSNSSIELGKTVEGYVVRSGESVLYHSGTEDERFFGTVLDEFGFSVSSMLCVGLNNLKEISGCLQLVNKKDGSLFTDDELKLCERTAALTALTIDEKGLTVNAG